MLYPTLKVIVLVAIRRYFKRIDVIGAEHLDEGRAIYVSNHPGAMIDPMLLAVNANRPFHFIAGAEWFGKGFKRWVFEDQLNMIPVFRPWLSNGKKREVQSNEDMFSACYERLEENKRILIYPEASSITVPWIRPLKTGAARIKIGADAFLKESADDKEEVKIIPVGMNYQNPHRFQTKATIVIGPPVDFEGVEKEGDLQSVSKAMTARIKEAMEACVLHTEEEEHFLVIKNVIKMMQPKVIEDLGIDPSDPKSAFKARKEIIRAVEYFKRNNLTESESLEEEIDNYVQEHQEEGFHKFNPFEEHRGEVLMRLLFVVIMLPFFLLGFMLNWIPYFLARSLFRSLLLEKVTGEHKEGELNPAFAGSLAFAVSVGVFLIWYIGLSILATNLYTWWVAIPVVCFVTYHSGRIALFYLRWLKRLRDVWHWKSLPKAKKEDMLAQRHRILRHLQVLKLQYLKNTQGGI